MRESEFNSKSEKNLTKANFYLGLLLCSIGYNE